MRKAPSIHIGILIAFLVNTFGILPVAQAQDFHLPVPGVMVHLSPPLDPPILKGIKVHPDNPFKFDFILDKGDGYNSHPEQSEGSQQEQLKEESTKLIKYFLASLTIPEKDLWVNLSPYEKDRIIPQSFGLTEMGRDLLAEDYMLKQITASLIYPEEAVGKKFWKRIYEESAKKFGTTNVPVNTFNKVWIVPEKAVVYENAKAGTAYVVESKLKVMLEQDYLSLEKHSINAALPLTTRNDVASVGANIVREIVIPELTKEVNEDKNFAQLRQVYNSLILATWYKKKIKDSILEQVYADKKKVAGVGYGNSVILSAAKDLKTPIDSSATLQNDTNLIYQRYLKAFKKGVYNYIKEEQDPVTQEIIPRKYFSGGFKMALDDHAMAVTDKASIVQNIITKSSMILITAALSFSIPSIARAQNTISQNPFSQMDAQRLDLFQRIVGDTTDFRGFFDKEGIESGSGMADNQNNMHTPYPMLRLFQQNDIATIKDYIKVFQSGFPDSQKDHAVEYFGDIFSGFINYTKKMGLQRAQECMDVFKASFSFPINRHINDARNYSDYIFLNFLDTFSDPSTGQKRLDLFVQMMQPRTEEWSNDNQENLEKILRYFRDTDIEKIKRDLNIFVKLSIDKNSEFSLEFLNGIFKGGIEFYEDLLNSKQRITAQPIISIGSEVISLSYNESDRLQKMVKDLFLKSRVSSSYKEATTIFQNNDFYMTGPVRYKDNDGKTFFYIGTSIQNVITIIMDKEGNLESMIGFGFRDAKSVGIFIDDVQHPLMDEIRKVLNPSEGTEEEFKAEISSIIKEQGINRSLKQGSNVQKEPVNMFYLPNPNVYIIGHRHMVPNIDAINDFQAKIFDRRGIGDSIRDLEYRHNIDSLLTEHADLLKSSRGDYEEITKVLKAQSNIRTLGVENTPEDAKKQAEVYSRVYQALVRILKLRGYQNNQNVAPDLFRMLYGASEYIYAAKDSLGFGELHLVGLDGQALRQQMDHRMDEFAKIFSNFTGMLEKNDPQYRSRPYFQRWDKLISKMPMESYIPSQLEVNEIVAGFNKSYRRMALKSIVLQMRCVVTIRDRDRFMAQHVQPNMLLIVGNAHAKGIVKNLKFENNTQRKIKDKAMIVNKGNQVNTILGENARDYGMTWRANGEVLLGDIFKKYMQQNHDDLIKGSFGNFSSLSNMFEGLATIDPADAFKYISGWMTRRFKELSQAGKEAQLAELTIDAARFVQVVLKGEIKTIRENDIEKIIPVNYNSESGTMGQLLDNQEWNCRSISDMTVFLMSLWGAHGIWAVNVVEDLNGNRYPNHAANLVKVGDRAAYLDQGFLSFDKGIIEMVINGRMEKIAVADIKSLNVQGLTADQMLHFYNSTNEINEGLTKIPGIEMAHGIMSIAPTKENAERIIEGLTWATKLLAETINQMDLRGSGQTDMLHMIDPEVYDGLGYRLKYFNERLKVAQDLAQSSKGGIDFNPAKLNLQIQNSGNGIKFHIDPAMLAQLQNAPGFTPVIINMQPLKNLQEFLGIGPTPVSV